MKQPLFSIITVTWNAAETIEPTMQSVASQSWTDYEHLIVDGASTDATLDIANRFQRDALRIDSRRDHGIYDAMNRGLHLAQGRYLIFLNAGDTFHDQETLASFARAIEQNPGVGMVYGQTQLVSGHERLPAGPRHLTAPHHLTADSFKHGMLVCHQAMAVDRKIAPDYDMKYRLSADFDWAIKCLKKSPLNVYVDQTVIDYLDEGATTRNHRRSLKERYHIMCHHYGTLPTVARHITFAIRQLKRKLS